MVSRREFMTGSAAAGSALLVTSLTAAQAHAETTAIAATAPAEPAQGPAADGGSKPTALGYTPVITPNGSTLPWRMVNGVKVFHLIAGPVAHEFAPGLSAQCWGYNGLTPGPTIEAVQGDRVRFYVENRLPEPTALHWHGIVLPNGMDGVAGLTQTYIQPGETYRYEFTFKHAGTFMYHPHLDEMTQMGMGLMGMLIVHPKTPARHIDRDFVIMLSEWKVPIGTQRPDPREMTEFNVLTLNGKAFPGTDALVARTGQRVRIRFGNLSAMHNHPMHLHGYSFKVTGTDGGAIPESAQHPETTVLVPVGATRDLEFVADAPGDWAMHCHFTHHIMNQMGHSGPNLIGMQTGDFDKRASGVLPGYMTMGQGGMAAMGQMKMRIPDNSISMQGLPGKHGYIDMGGMFTILKVRDGLQSFEDPGWYENPAGTLARLATADELAADGVKIG